MNTLLRLYLVATATLLTTFSIGQTISGKVTDETSSPLPFANVVLRNIDSSIVAATTTSLEGLFELKGKSNNYLLEVSYLGFQSKTQPISLKNSGFSIGTIVLKESTNVLGEVLISAEKRVVERKIDRLVFNVEKSLAATGGNGLDAIQITPGIQLQNDELSILGKGATQVMINGRLSPLEGEELIHFLSSFSANDILKIEVITNPPAQYDAAGNGGLVNIILKKGAQNSWRNSTVLSYNQNRYNYTNVANNFLYNKKKLSFSSSINVTKGFVENLEGLQINYPNNFWDIDINGKIKKDQLSSRFLIDYNISDKTTLGFQYLGNTSKPSIESTIASNIFNNEQERERFLLNKGVNEVSNQNHSVNVHSITKIDTLGRQLSFDADYFLFNSDRSLDFFTEQFSQNNISEGLTSSALNLSNQQIENISSNVNIIQPLKKVNLSYGVKASLTRTKSGVQFFNTLLSQPILDTAQSNDFEYKESVLAAYISGETDLSKKVSIQFGLRFEDTQSEGFNISLSQKNTNDYSRFFPSIHLVYNKDENNNFHFAYGRRINRPNFRNLNPFRFYINDNSYSVGNPFLQPSFSDNIAVGHLYKNNLNSNVSLNITSNGFGVFFNTDIENQDQVITRENYFTKYTYRLEESFSFNKLSWWRSQNSLNLLFHITVLTRNLNAENNNGIQFYGESNNTFSFYKKTKLLANVWYSSSHNDGIFSFGELFHLSLGFRHDFKDNLKLSVLFSDIFNTGSLRDLNSTVNGIEQNYRQNESSRNVRISLTYNVGNNSVKVRNRSFSNDAEQRRSR